MQHARAYNDYYEFDYNLYYWRTYDKTEVDVVLYGQKGFFAFEIKRKAHLDAKDFKGLQAFRKDYPEAKRYMIYGGNKSYFENDIHVIPFHQSLSQLPDILQSY